MILIFFRTIKYVWLIYKGKIDKVIDLLSKEKNIRLKKFIYLEVLENKKDFLEWLKVYSIEMSAKYLKDNLKKFLYFCKICINEGKYIQVLSFSRDLISRRLLSKEEYENVYRVWCRCAFDLHNNEEISSCINRYRSEGYPPDSPLIKWHSKYISEQ